MSHRRKALRITAALALAMSLVGTAFFAPAAVAKKKKAPNVFSKQVTSNAPITDPAAAGIGTPLASTLVVPKAFKGREVADVNVTGLQTTGSAAGAAVQLTAYLTAPGGRTLQLFLGVGDQSLGPWTMDDDTRVSICNSSGPVCADPDQALYRPFVGTSNLLTNFGGLFPVNGNLTIFNGVSMRGTWTLRVVDATNGLDSVLNQWGLRIQAAKKVAK